MEALPYVGAVIRYGYLWRDEARAGRREPRKWRPCVILTVDRRRDRIEVSVAPITHTEPEAAYAIRLSARTLQRLGLDAREPSWINAREINLFDWRGVDVVPTVDGRDHFGPIPPVLREATVTAFRESVGARAGGATRRDA